MVFVFLNPDGTAAMPLFALVDAMTGVTYAHQCGGLSNQVRQQQGFLVPVGKLGDAILLHEFFARFRGNPPDTLGIQWTDIDLDELSAIVNNICLWMTSASGGSADRPIALSLDKDRVDDLTEGWIPVDTCYGNGILLF